MSKEQQNETLERFAGLLKDAGKSDNTIRNYMADMRHVINNTPPNKGHTPQNTTQKAIETYVHQSEKSGLSKSTVNRRLQSLRTYFHLMKQAGHIDEDPTEGITQLKVAKQNTTDWLERYQVKAIFNAIESRKMPEHKRIKDRAIIMVLVNCGLRLQELCDVKMSDIDWDKNIMKVVGKGDKYRIVPFNPGTKKALQRWLQYRDVDTPYLFHTERSDFMTTRAVQHMIKGLNDELNFAFKPHQLRHTALKRVADVTGRIESVAEFAGHDSIETSRRYITPSMKEINEAMKESEYDF